MKKLMFSILLVILLLGIVVAESDVLYSQQRGALVEYCCSQNFNCDLPNAYQNNTQEYNMKQYCCSNNINCNNTKKEKKQEIREQIREHNKTLWKDSYGKNITIREVDQDKLEIIADKISAKTGLNITAEDLENGTSLSVFLSNGRNVLIKIMPDTASAHALEVLGAKCEGRNCTVELKEVGNENKTKLAYEVTVEETGKVFFIFKNKHFVQAQVDSETGEVLEVKKPWWTFLFKKNK
jgi:hypothetical protein